MSTQMLFFFACASACTAWSTALALRSDAARQRLWVIGAVVGANGLIIVAVGALLSLINPSTLLTLIQATTLGGGWLVAFIGLALMAGSIVGLEPRLQASAQQSTARRWGVLMVGIVLAAIAGAAGFAGDGISGRGFYGASLASAVTWLACAAAVACFAAFVKACRGKK